MGRVDPAQYFWSGVTPCGRGRPPPGLILLVKPKFQVVAPNGLAKIFSYILVKALMGNFQFRRRMAIFWRGHRCKKKFWDFFSYTYDPSKKWSDEPEIENLSLIHKSIHKNLFLGANPKYFLTKLILRVYLVQLPTTPMDSRVYLPSFRSLTRLAGKTWS